MPDFPHIALHLITFNRLETLQRTLEALRENLIYPQERLHIVISDDSTGGKYLSQIKRLKVLKEWGASVDVISTEERSGWGKHVNWAMGWIKKRFPVTDYIFFCEDDYVLTEKIDLRVGVALLEKRPNIGMLRYRGTAGTHCVYHQFEADISDYLPEHDESAGQSLGRVSYLQLDSGSPTLYLYSHGAHLKRFTSAEGEYPDFHSFYGLYPEGLPLGSTEEQMAHLVKDAMKLTDAPAIAILPNFIKMVFQHIGESYQGSEHDIHNLPKDEIPF